MWKTFRLRLHDRRQGKRAAFQSIVWFFHYLKKRFLVSIAELTETVVEKSGSCCGFVGTCLF